MATLQTWLDTHRWIALAGCVAGLSLSVVGGDLVPRAVVAAGLYRTWQHQTARIAEVEHWDQEQAWLFTHEHRLRRRFESLYVSLPRSDHMSTILHVLQAGADSEGVSLRGVRPGDPVAFAQVDEVPFDVDAQGTFHALGAFLRRIERSRHVIKVRRMQVRRASAGADELKAALTLSVIILKEGEEGL